MAEAGAAVAVDALRSIAELGAPFDLRGLAGAFGPIAGVGGASGHSPTTLSSPPPHRCLRVPLRGDISDVDSPDGIDRTSQEALVIVCTGPKACLRLAAAAPRTCRENLPPAAQKSRTGPPTGTRSHFPDGDRVRTSSAEMYRLPPGLLRDGHSPRQIVALPRGVLEEIPAQRSIRSASRYACTVRCPARSGTGNITP
jgi:hypothetical protein